MMNEQQSLVNAAVWHVISSILLAFVETGFLIAQEDELSDLKDLVMPNSVCMDTAVGDGQVHYGDTTIETDLLGILDDPLVKRIHRTLTIIMDCSERYWEVMGFDFDEVLENTRPMEIAQETIRDAFYFDGMEDDWMVDRRQLEKSVDELYSAMDCLLSVCRCQLAWGEVQVREAMFEIYGDKITVVDGLSLEVLQGLNILDELMAEMIRD